MPVRIADANEAVVITVGSTPVVFVRRSAVRTKTQRVPVYRWKLVYLPANVVEAETRGEKRCAAVLPRWSLGRTVTGTEGLVVFLTLTVYDVLRSGCTDAVNAPFVVVCAVATLTAPLVPQPSANTATFSPPLCEERPPDSVARPP